MEKTKRFPIKKLFQGEKGARLRNVMRSTLLGIVIGSLLIYNATGSLLMTVFIAILLLFVTASIITLIAFLIKKQEEGRSKSDLYPNARCFIALF